MTVKTIMQVDPDTLEETGAIVATVTEISDAEAQAVIDAPAEDETGNGRSKWMAVRFQNGDLMVACYPHGDTYIELSDKIKV